MTREIGCHGSDVAAGVAAELGMDIVNSEIAVSNVAGSLGVEQSTVQRYLDGSASIFERWQIDKRKLSRFTSEQIFRLAQRGNVLIRGWGTNALFRDIPQVISVRICAPIKALYAPRLEKPRKPEGVVTHFVAKRGRRQSALAFAQRSRAAVSFAIKPSVSPPLIE
jgi:hypothetical protein